MSDRRTSDTESRSKDWIRRMEDRLDSVEHGAFLGGVVSFGSVLEIGGDNGGVIVEVVDTGNDGRNVVFTNNLTGASYTITL